MSRLCLVTAIAAESRPWLDRLKLRHLNARGLRLYGSDTCLLLQTGVGKLPAAAAVGALLQSRTDITQLVNIGIAGGADSIGSVHMANLIQDVATGMRWYPHLAPKKLIKDMHYSAVHTVDQPKTDYQPDILFDMEASAIISAASGYLSNSQIHCIKVVSDNPSTGLHTIDKRRIIELVQASMPSITHFLDGLMKLSTLSDDDLNVKLSSCASVIMGIAHHTANDQIQLKRLLQRLHALSGATPSPEDFLICNSAKAIRDALNDKIQSIPFTYNG